MIFFVVYMSLKRPLGPPSGNTPDKPPQKSRRSQRRETTSRKSFFFQPRCQDENGIYSLRISWADSIYCFVSWP